MTKSPKMPPFSRFISPVHSSCWLFVYTLAVCSGQQWLQVLANRNVGSIFIICLFTELFGAVALPATYCRLVHSAATAASRFDHHIPTEVRYSPRLKVCAAKLVASVAGSTPVMVLEEMHWELNGVMGRPCRAGGLELLAPTTMPAGA